MYMVVTFKRDGDIALVPETWMSPDHEDCYWPPFKNQQKITKSVKDAIQPDKDTWTLYEVNVLYSSSSYEKARKKLPMAEDTSDLYTEEEESQARKKRKTLRYLSSSTSEDEIDNESTCRSPNRMILSLPVAPQRQSPQPSCSTSGQHPTGPIYQHHQDLPTLPRRSPRRPSPMRRRLELGISPEHSSFTQSQRQATRTLTSPTVPEYVRQLMTAIETNTAKVVENNRLLHQLVTMSSAHGAMEEVGPTIKLPITSLDELRVAEADLQDHQIFRNLVTTLGTTGGSTVKETVSRILRQIISHPLALKISWSGSAGKAAFRVFQTLKDVVIKAALRNTALKSSTKAEVESRILLWFRYAADREGGKKARVLRRARETEQIDDDDR